MIPLNLIRAKATGVKGDEGLDIVVQLDANTDSQGRLVIKQHLILNSCGLRSTSSRYRLGNRPSGEMITGPAEFADILKYAKCGPPSRCIACCVDTCALTFQVNIFQLFEMFSAAMSLCLQLGSSGARQFCTAVQYLRAGGGRPG
jgi:hypothetical protein